MAVTLRNVKGTELTFNEVDGNFQSLYYSSSLNGDQLTFYFTASSISHSITIPSGGTSASYALTSSYIDPTFISASAADSGFGSGGGGPAFPFTGSAIITGSLTVTGSSILNGNFLVTRSFGQLQAADTASYIAGLIPVPSSDVSYTGSVIRANINSTNTGTQIDQTLIDGVMGLSGIGNDLPTTMAITSVLSGSNSFISQTGYLDATILGGTVLFGTETNLYITSSLGILQHQFSVSKDDDYPNGIIRIGTLRDSNAESCIFQIEGGTSGFEIGNNISNTTASIFRVLAANTSASLDIKQSYVVLPQVSASFDFADDAAAATGGVPLGGLYHTSGSIKIRLT